MEGARKAAGEKTVAPKDQPSPTIRREDDDEGPSTKKTFKRRERAQDEGEGCNHRVAMIISYII